MFFRWSLDGFGSCRRKFNIQKVHKELYSESGHKLPVPMTNRIYSLNRPIPVSGSEKYHWYHTSTNYVYKFCHVGTEDVCLNTQMRQDLTVLIKLCTT